MLVRFATANLFNYLAPPSAYYEFSNIYEAEQWNKKQKWLDRKLSEMNADVIGFQEIFSAEALKLQLKHQGYRYFAVVDEPKITQDYIYTHPVVGVASRFKLSEIQAVEISQPNHTEAFAFNRKPLRATLHHPALGDVDLYVVHFKSQRPTLHQEEANNEFDAWQQETYGKWVSSVQRGYEAHLLHKAIMERKRLTNNPVVLMGDFNQILSSQEFSALRSTHRFRRSESYTPLLPYHLIDSWELCCHADKVPRKPTHYTGASGQVLDYILLSSDFSTEADHPIAHVVDHHVEDQHLINPNFEHDSFSSDHAFVTVDVKCAKSVVEIL